jgi:bacteriocin biosynthesis cyclodehydratase domain-containing protein
VASEPPRSTQAERNLRLAEAVDVVPVPDGLVVHTSTATLRLEGGIGRLMKNRLIPALDTRPTRDSLLANLHDLPRAEIDRLLDRLMESGVVVEVSTNDHETIPAWTELFGIGVEQRQALIARATEMEVTIVGAGQLCEVLARTLIESGFGVVRLAEPVSATRTAGVADMFAAQDPTDQTDIKRCTIATTRESIYELASRSDLVITAVQPDMAAIRVWVNEASMSESVPSLHAAVRGAHATVGPLVLPGDGPCYLCWRMRAIACERDFETAMAIEEALDAAREPATSYPVLPTIIPAVAAALAREAFALGLGVLKPRLPGRVLEMNGIDGTEQLHAVLPRPDCPVCRKKDHRPHETPRLGELLAAEDRTTDFDLIAAETVSSLCGLIRHLGRLPKDVAEPEAPVIVGAELANSRFLTGEQALAPCGGKGSDVIAARNGALGEAIERYAAMTWIPDRRFVGTRAAVPGATLHPADLVLYQAAQYAQLPYARYDDETVLEWVPARSLGDDGERWVPLLAAHLGYQVPNESAFLFPPTSNGFAAGPTLTFAVLKAMLEVVERDAFLIAWSHRLAGSRYDARTVPDAETRHIALAYARRGVQVDIYLLPTDTVSAVALAVAWSDELPAAVVGLGADLDPAQAARHAVLEVAQVRPALRARLGQREVVEHMLDLVRSPSAVQNLDDHDLLYADHGSARRALAFLSDCPRRPWDQPAAPSTTPAAALSTLVPSVKEAAGDVLYLDVTPRDVDRLGVRVARVIVPGFQPIHFGADRIRLGHERLRRMPADIGLRDRPARFDELNLDPHPIA